MARPRRDRRPAVTLPETDERFPSGIWIGFAIDKRKKAPHRQWLNVALWFYGGKMLGRGRDRSGAFVVDGRYEVAEGRCIWTQKYIGKHEVGFEGYNEGQGIWGVWSRPEKEQKGGFRIWPESMPEPSGQGLSAQNDLFAEYGFAPPLADSPEGG